MVLGNRVSKLFKTAKQKLASFVSKKTDDKVLKVSTDKVSETVDTKKRKAKKPVDGRTRTGLLGYLVLHTANLVLRSERYLQKTGSEHSHQ